MLLTYHGPHSGAVVINPGGGRVVVARGERADFPESVAMSLLEQGEDHWTEAKIEKAPANKADTPKEVK